MDLVDDVVTEANGLLMLALLLLTKALVQLPLLLLSLPLPLLLLLLFGLPLEVREELPPLALLLLLTA